MFQKLLQYSKHTLICQTFKYSSTIHVGGDVICPEFNTVNFHEKNQTINKNNKNITSIKFLLLSFRICLGGVVSACQNFKNIIVNV